MAPAGSVVGLGPGLGLGSRGSGDIVAAAELLIAAYGYGAGEDRRG